MKDKTVIITGAARGLGQKYTIEFAKLGSNVVFADISSCDETEDKIKKITSNYLNLDLDVTNFNSCLKLVDNAKSKFKSIDVLINNAALYGALKSSRFEDIDEDQWDKAMNVNVKGVWNCIRAVIPSMREQKSGSIINIASLAALYGMPYAADYAASKAGIIGMTKSLAIEYAKKNITLNCVSPGFIQSRMTDNIIESVKAVLTSRIPMSRLGNGEDVANSVIFLSSDQASYITGETLHVNGGMYMA